MILSFRFMNFQSFLVRMSFQHRSYLRLILWPLPRGWIEIKSERNIVHRAAYLYAENTYVSPLERTRGRTFVSAKVPHCICQFILQNKPLDTNPESS